MLLSLASHNEVMRSSLGQKPTWIVWRGPSRYGFWRLERRSAICQVVVGLCLGSVDLDAAVMAPRLHVEGEHLDFEDLYDESVRGELVRVFADHRAWPERNMFYGGVHSVGMDSAGRLSGRGDSRRDGTAILVE